MRKFWYKILIKYSEQKDYANSQLLYQDSESENGRKGELGVYEGIKIPEYWIVDYLALGSKKFTGNPKQPTIFIYSLIEEEYQMTQFRGRDRIVSPTFPELNLTAEDIFSAKGFPN
ncbi:hypothetical protein F7734_37610 [Scytonema sp. UIC 10036]|uniref:Uma2 family endonuclease n=1 Tax=Scytonema sp. UIC 10036 TaxID=2304196 RepID=UPI0012DA15D1|nr:Uma2 family endonuclease [Scytonema sp. UIC 10036]MUG97723.1 hypothetical protein [Scytonema sp. UIC 10036]